MKDENKKNIKTLLIFVLASVVSTHNVFMENITGISDYLIVVFCMYVIFSMIVRIMEKYVPKKKEEEDDE